MFILLCGILLFQDVQGSGSLGDIGLYQRLFKGMVALSETGDIFVLDRTSKQVIHFKNGVRLANVSRPGRGPGELAAPTGLSFLNGRLYVYDQNRVHIFTEQGKYISQFKKKQRLLFLKRVESGWIGLKGLYPDQHRQPVELIFQRSEDDWEVVHAWSSEHERYPRKDDGDDVVYFNPVEQASRLHVSGDGTLVAVLIAGLDDIFLFKMPGGQLIRTLTIDGPLIPFDEEFGEEHFKVFCEGLKSIPGLKVKRAFPKYFPKISGLEFSWDNRLIVHRGYSPKKAPKGLKRVSVFDENWKEVNQKPLDLELHRIIDVRNQLAYLISYISDDHGYTVAWVPLKSVQDFVDTNTLPNYTKDSIILK